MDNIVTDVSTEKNDLSLSTELKFPLPPSRSPATERVEVLLEQYKARKDIEVTLYNYIVCVVKYRSDEQ